MVVNFSDLVYALFLNDCLLYLFCFSCVLTLFNPDSKSRGNHDQRALNLENLENIKTIKK